MKPVISSSKENHQYTWKSLPATWPSPTIHWLVIGKTQWSTEGVKIETYSIYTRLWGKWILNTPLPIFLNGTTRQVTEIPSWDKRKSMKILDPKEKLWWHHGGSWWRKLASHFPNLLRRWTTKTTGGPYLIAGSLRITPAPNLARNSDWK